MRNDSIKQYSALRESLLKEQAQLEDRLAKITEALGTGSKPSTKPAAVSGKSVGAATRAKNPMSLREAVMKVTSKKALTKLEIFDAVKKLGYTFGGKDPMNSLNVVLYTNKQFKRTGKTFAPAVRSKA